MLFWVYRIDWRTRAVTVLHEVASEQAAYEKIAEHFTAIKDKAEREQELAFATVAFTVCSLDMVAVNERFTKVRA